MSYRVNPDGTIDVDELEQAILLSKRLAGLTATHLPVTTPAPAPAVTPAQVTATAPAPGAAAVTQRPAPAAAAQPSKGHANLWREYIVKLGDNSSHRRFVEMLKACPSGVPIDAAREQLGLQTNAQVSGVISSLLRNLTFMGIERDEVFVIDTEGRRPNHTIKYRPGKLVLES